MKAKLPRIESLFASGLRAATLFGKFALLLALGRYMTPAEVGMYGIMVAGIGIAQYSFGFEFYHFVTRQAVIARPEAKVLMFRDQAIFHLTMIGIGGYFLVAVFETGLMPIEFMGWFIIIACLEMIAQEGHRILITMDKPVNAAFAMFIRGGAWTYVAVLMLIVGYDINLDTIWALWALFCYAGVGVTYWNLRNLPWHLTIRQKINFGWIKRGLKTSVIYFGTGMCTLLIQYIDLFMVKHFLGLDKAGVYTFFLSIARSVQVLVFTGSTMVYLPKITRKFREGDIPEYQRLKRDMLKVMLVTSAFFTSLAAIGISPVMGITDNEIYRESIDIFWLMLIAMVFINMADTHHLSLYVRFKDKYLFQAAFAALITAVLLDIILIPRIGIHGAAVSCVASAFVFFITKLIFARHFSKDERNPTIRSAPRANNRADSREVGKKQRFGLFYRKSAQNDYL
jgi:O-antigen/teichoic acid export membrane protein